MKITCVIVKIGRINFSIIFILREPANTNAFTALVNILHCLTNEEATFRVSNCEKFVSKKNDSLKT